MMEKGAWSRDSALDAFSSDAIPVHLLTGKRSHGRHLSEASRCPHNHYLDRRGQSRAISNTRRRSFTYRRDQ